ncbi:MAG: phage baseplate assembly protein V [Isosphaeraceae bacterium]
MDRLLNVVRREVERCMARFARARAGIVTSYDPDNYAAKVMLQPEGVETGWLPIRTPWSGNGWGVFCPPSPGDEVEVGFQEGGKQAGYIRLRAFGDRSRPLSVPSGEFWVVHGSGASIKLRNDGTLVMTDGFGAVFTLNGSGGSEIAALAISTTVPRWDHAGIFNATKYYAEGVPTVADGTYCTGLGLAQNGTITITGGLITAIQEAS